MLYFDNDVRYDQKEKKNEKYNSVNNKFSVLNATILVRCENKFSLIARQQPETENAFNLNRSTENVCQFIQLLLFFRIFCS